MRMLRSVLSKAGFDDDSDDSDDILPRIMTTIQDIDEMETCLREKQYRRKFVSLLILLYFSFNFQSVVPNFYWVNHLGYIPILLLQ